MSLQKRKESLDDLSATSVLHERLSDLLLLYRTKEMNEYRTLTESCMQYLQSSRISSSFSSVDSANIDTYSETSLPNLTPNGLIVAKKYLTLEYNRVIRDFIALIDTMGIGQLIDTWYGPVNVRLKRGKEDERNKDRLHPTEISHSDAWGSGHTGAVTIHVLIAGDVENNHVSIMEPNKDFEEEWLTPRREYEPDNDLLSRYKKINQSPSPGDLVVMDTGILHATERKAGAGSRLSIDAMCTLKNRNFGFPHPYKRQILTLHSDMERVGYDLIFYSPDTDTDTVDTKMGVCSPYNIKLQTLW